MAAKIKITPEGLNLMISVSNAGYSDGFYNKEVYFTDGFKGDTQYLFQALGNIGAYARRKDIDADVTVVIVSNEIIQVPESDAYKDFVNQFENLFNQKNTPYLRLKFMSEEDLLNYLSNRAANFNDEDLKEFVRKYKATRPRKSKKKEIEKEKIQSETLFD